MLYVIAIVIVLIIIIIGKILNRNDVKVQGKLIRFEIENNKHYPVFAFDTKDGKHIEARCKKYKEEISVEDVYKTEKAEEFLNNPLPIENIPILYNKKDPEEFIPQWV